jgi:hypothetical protein
VARSRRVKADLIAVGDPRWASVLQRARHDFYHLPEYVALAARHEGAEGVALHVTDGERALLLPVLVRPIAGGDRDATTPYGYSGPVVAGSHPAEDEDEDEDDFVERALGAATAMLADQGVVSVFVRLHPLLNHRPPTGIGTVVRGGDTVSIDLTLPDAEQWRQVRGNHRVHINRAARTGREMRFDHAGERLGDFARLYRSTMSRLDATPYYFFGDDYFQDLAAALGDRFRLAFVDVDGELAAAASFVETCGIVQYHLSASDPRMANEGLTKVVIDGVRRWATNRGDTALHLGGGTRGGTDDPLLHFKAGFSDVRHPFHTLRIVVDADAYVRQALASGIPPGDPSLSDHSGFFPAYRRPDLPASAVARHGS